MAKDLLRKRRFFLGNSRRDDLRRRQRYGRNSNHVPRTNPNSQWTFSPTMRLMGRPSMACQGLRQKHSMVNSHLRLLVVFEEKSLWRPEPCGKLSFRSSYRSEEHT